MAYTLPFDYALQYATAIAHEISATNAPVRVYSSTEGDVTGDVLGRRESSPVVARTPSKVAKGIAAGFIAIVILVIGVAAFSGGSSRSGATTAGAPTASAPIVEKPVAVSAHQLFAAYNRNEIQADNAFKGRLLLITGTIESINKDFMDNPYLVLNSPNMFIGVHAELAEGTSQTAAQLAPGERVSVLCRGGGMVVGSPMLKDCRLE